MAQGERPPIDNVQDVVESKWKGVGCDRTIPEREPRNDYSQQLLTPGEREIAELLTGTSRQDIQSINSTSSGGTK